MSSIYSRKMYDACFQKEIENTTKGPGNYVTNKIQKPNKPMYVVQDVMSYKDNVFNPALASNVGNLVNIESHLMRIDNKDSKCVTGRTLEDMNKCGESLVNKIPKNRVESNKMLNSSYSRMERPALDVREMTTSRFDHPIEDPRKSVYHGMTEKQNGDERFGFNSRLMSKDMYAADFYEEIEKSDRFVSN